MEIVGVVNVMVWINIYVCYPFTLLIISLCFAVRMDHVPITYYMNLLALNLIQNVNLILFMAKKNVYDLSYKFLYVAGFSAIGSLYFRMIIALERCFFIFRPQLHFIRQTKGFVTICLSVWIFCVVISPLSTIYFRLIITLSFLPPGLVFIVCLVLIIKSLPVATSVSTEEKRRIVATLVVLLINYTITNVPIFCYSSFALFPFNVFWALLLFGPFLDLILFVVNKGLIDKLLTRLCCCRMENSAENDSRGTSAAQTDRKNEREEKENKM